MREYEETWILIPKSFFILFWEWYLKVQSLNEVSPITCSLFHCSGPVLLSWLEIFGRSLEKLVEEPDKSKVRLGEYAGEESLDTQEGDGCSCCFQGVEPARGDSVCGTTFLTTHRFANSDQKKTGKERKPKWNSFEFLSFVLRHL